MVITCVILLTSGEACVILLTLVTLVTELYGQLTVALATGVHIVAHACILLHAVLHGSTVTGIGQGLISGVSLWRTGRSHWSLFAGLISRTPLLITRSL